MFRMWGEMKHFECANSTLTAPDVKIEPRSLQQSGNSSTMCSTIVQHNGQGDREQVTCKYEGRTGEFNEIVQRTSGDLLGHLKI